MNTADFLREYFRGTTGRIYLCAIRNGGSKLPGREIAKLAARSTSAATEFVANHDKPKNECGIFFCTATLLRDGKEAKRDATQCLEFVSLFSDIDNGNHLFDQARVIEMLEACECPPTMIVNSGYGLHPHWLFSEPSEDAERVIEVRKRLQAITASDKVHDAPRLLRLPGSHNSKRGGWVPAEVVAFHPERHYTLEALQDWLDTAGTIIERKPVEKPKSNDAPFVMPVATGRTTDHKRGAAWAQKALEDNARELANTPGGQRHGVLLNKANRMGTMVARGWIDVAAVRGALLAASHTCGEIEEYGMSHFEDTLRAGLKYGIGHPHPELPNNDPPPRATNGAHAGTEKAAAVEQKPASRLLRSTRASTIEMTAVEWVWPDRFALGKLGILGGLPDQGKGLIFADMAARVSRGLEWPCNEGRAPQGNVILLTAEDDPNDTVVPRLAAAGADLDCIDIVSMVHADGKDRMFNLMSDIDLLRQKIAEVGNVRMVQIDPLSAYLGVGKMDSYRTTDVRGVLAPLVALAAETKILLAGIMHFNKKGDVTNAMLRISDSLAWVATARTCFVVVDDELNKRKLLLKAKNNVGRDTKCLAYGVGVVNEVGRDPHTGKIISAPHVIWHPQYVDVTTTEAMQADANGRSPAARDSAKKFLADLLANGPVPKTEVEEAAEANCISERTLRRAKDELGVIASKASLDKGWNWQLPESKKTSWHDDK